MRPIIALLTDFGSTDWLVGSMKVVILSRVADCAIVDLCHTIEPGAVGQAAWLLERTFRDFPPSTVFCTVVDPGVGTGRRAIAALGTVAEPQAGSLRHQRYFFVAPDNGLLTGVRRHVQNWRCCAITNAGWMRSEVSQTFHGRDIFAPAAAQIALEGGIENAGEPIADPVEIEPPGATPAANGSIEGTIILFDRFGNAISTIARNTLGGATRDRAWRVVLGDLTVEPVSSTFADVAPGEAVAYWGSLGTLEIAIRNGNARERLGLHLGQRISLRPILDVQA